VATLKVDDTEAPHAERDRPVHILALVVRTTVHEGREHAIEQNRILWNAAGRGVAPASNATHFFSLDV
jgi:hypothetical protein